MEIEVEYVEVGEVLPLRELYRREMNCQIIHDSFPRRGFSDPYLIRASGRVAGYGLVANRHFPRAVHEFYVVPACRSKALPLFRELLASSGARKIRAQSNDPLLALMLYDCATHISSPTLLFADVQTTHHPSPGGVLRKVTDEDHKTFFAQHHEPPGEWMIELDGAAVATGGALYHYNPPYGDIYMEVHEDHRGRGFGSYMVQEMKRFCYEIGKTPAARCNVKNVASRRTLEKAGLLPCGRILEGRVAK